MRMVKVRILPPQPKYPFKIAVKLASDDLIPTIDTDSFAPISRWNNPYGQNDFSTS